jgi:hypothetical protein
MTKKFLSGKESTDLNRDLPTCFQRLAKETEMPEKAKVDRNKCLEFGLKGLQKYSKFVAN